MAIFYADHLGTCDTGTPDNGRETVERTGAFDTDPANNFPSIRSILTTTGTPFALGDSIRMASDSSFANLSNVEWPFPTGGATHIISVDVTAQEEALAGATETNGALDIKVTTGQGVFEGVTIVCGDDWNMNANSAATFKGGTGANKAVFRMNRVGNRFDVQQDACYLSFEDCPIIYTLGTTSAVFNIRGATSVKIRGGGITADANNIDRLANESASGGFIIEIFDADLSDVQKITTGIGAAVIDDMIKIFISGCETSASLVPTDEEKLSRHQEMTISKSSDTSDARKYQHFEHRPSGEVEAVNKTEIVRVDSDSQYPGEDVSWMVTTNTDCSIAMPFTFRFPTRSMDLADTTKTIVIRAIVVDTIDLNNANVWFTVTAPTSGAEQTPLFFDNRNTNLLAAGVDWGIDSVSTWENNEVEITSGFNAYEIILVTTGAAKCVPDIEMNIAIPSIGASSDNIFFSVAVGLVT